MLKLRQQPVQPLRLCYVADNPDQPYAAIAPHAAAKEYGLEILAKDIQEIEKNYTRFWLLGSTVPEIPLNQINCKLTLGLNSTWHIVR